jgi:hypothetical protein
MKIAGRIEILPDQSRTDHAAVASKQAAVRLKRENRCANCGYQDGIDYAG